MLTLNVPYGELLHFYNTYWSYMGARRCARLGLLKTIRKADPTQPVRVDVAEFKSLLGDTEAKLSLGDRYRYRKLYALLGEAQGEA
jgi:hypothetical protein